MNLRYLAYALIGGMIIGYLIGFSVSRPKVIAEKPLPASRQIDGSLVLERKPDPQAKSKQAIPRGDKVERIVSVEVKTPKPVDDVKVDLTLVSEPDGSKRVIASSPDGKVTGGLDIPVANITIPKQLNWSAGPVYDFRTKKYGGFVQYRKSALIAQVVVVGDNVLIGVGLTF